MELVQKPKRRPRIQPPPPHIRETILWVLVLLCQLGVPVSSIVSKLTGAPAVAHHATVLDSVDPAP